MMIQHEALVSELVARQRPGFCLEQPFYNDQQVFEHDVQRIFLPSWQFAGHAARIPNVGDYFLFKTVGESVILARGRDDEIHAFINVCRHRGSRVCLADEGNAKAFVCPYHAWTYGLDGTLLSAKTMPADFNATEYGLHRCHVRTIEGLIYINLSERPEDFEPVVRDAIEYFHRYELERTKIAERLVWNVSANWKLVWENFQECYHCGPAHPEYCSVMDHALGETIGSARTREAFAEYTAHWKALAAAQGLLTESKLRDTADKSFSVNRHPIKPGFLTQSPDGQPAAPLLGHVAAYDGGMTTLSMYPGHFVTVASDHAIAFRFTPQDVTHTEVELTWLVREGAEAGTDYDADRLTWLWRVTTDQDKQIVDDNQAGVNSRFYQPGPYADTEPGVKHFVNWYLRQIS
jgi:Rieske 2Fe-2S family protein